MPFQKGQSGNPGGRPKEAVGLKEFIFRSTNNGEDLVKKLLDIMNFAPEPKDKVAAIKVLMEYSIGKPAQPMEHSGEIRNGSPLLKFSKVGS